MGLLVLSFFCGGITAMVLFSLRSSHANIMKNTAYTTAQGFLEQIESLPEMDIQAALDDPANVPLPTVGISAIQTGNIQFSEPLYLDDNDPSTIQDLNYKEVLVDIKRKEGQADKLITMDIWLTVTMEPLSLGPGQFVSIAFEYESKGTTQIGRRSGFVQTVRVGSAN